jgi:hypothetical protein
MKRSGKASRVEVALCAIECAHVLSKCSTATNKPVPCQYLKVCQTLSGDTHDDPEAQAYQVPPAGHVGPKAGRDADDMSQKLSILSKKRNQGT